MKTLNKTLIALAAALASAAALADVNIGVSLSLTGPGSGLGIPMQNYYKIFPQTIAGEKVNLIVLDDASDPGKGAQNARRFVTDDKVDMIIGSCLTTVAAAMVDVAAESGTVQLAASPVGTPPGKDAWMFRLPQSQHRDGPCDGQAHEEAGREDRRLPRLHRRLRRAVAQGVHADRREGGHQDDRRRALRPCRHQRHAAGPQAGRGQPGRDADRRLRQRRRACRRWPSSSAATRARSTRPTRRPRRT